MAVLQREGVRRYPVLGGTAALPVPFFTAMAAAGALAAQIPEAAVLAVLAGWLIQSALRSVTIEVSPTGLTRGLVLKGTFIGRTTVIGWSTVEDVHTGWCRPDQDSALETTVRGRDGSSIRISTGMGLGPYWACVADIVGHVPPAVATGLTAEFLAEGPPARRDVLSAAVPTAALAVILLLLVLLHYVWAQGPSVLSRYLEQTAGSTFAPR